MSAREPWSTKVFQLQAWQAWCWLVPSRHHTAPCSRAPTSLRTVLYKVVRRRLGTSQSDLWGKRTTEYLTACPRRVFTRRNPSLPHKETERHIPVIQQNRKGDRSKREVKFVEIGSLVSPRSESQEERNEQRYNKAYHPRHMQRWSPGAVMWQNWSHARSRPTSFPGFLFFPSPIARWERRYRFPGRPRTLTATKSE